MRNEYGLFRRAGAKVWYFWYYEGHKRITKSTGKHLKHEAKQYVEDFLKTADQKQIRFKDFTKDFFIWDTCLWVKKQHAYKRPLTKIVVNSKRKMLENHLLPAFGDYYLHQITKADIENFLISLDRSEQTKNHLLFTLRQIMREAEDQGLIEHSIAERVRPFPVKPKSRGVFTLDELRLLFPDNEKELLNIWWDRKHIAMFLVLACTGVRSGELRALLWEDYLKEHKALFIRRAVKDDAGTIGETKTGEQRLCPLSDKTIVYIEKWRDISPSTTQHDLLFYGELPGKPYNKRSLCSCLYSAFKRAGIPRTDRTVHSFRHTFNTIFRNILPDTVLRLLTGHKTEKMTNHYDSPGVEDFLQRIEPARAAIERLF